MSSSLYDIKYFMEAARCLNFSRAAERLGVRQSTLSQAIHRVEDAMGVSLFLRSKSGVKLTKSGVLFLARAKDLVERWEGLRDEVNKSETEIRGHYSFGCHPSIGAYILPQFVPQLYHEFPQIELQFFFEPSRLVGAEVINFHHDFGIVFGAISHPDLVIHSLWKGEISLWMKQDELTRKRFEAGLLPLIRVADSQPTDELMSLARKKLKLEFRRTIHCSTLETTAALVAAGTGVGALSHWSIRDAGPVEKVPGAPVISVPSSFIYRKDMQKSVAARKIIELIKETARQNG